MRPEPIWRRWQTRPFKPFLLTTSDQKAYAVTHPEMLRVSKLHVHVLIFSPGQRPGEDMAEHAVSFGPECVARMDELSMGGAPVDR